MLLIDNDTVKRVLTMRECIQAQEHAFKGTLTGASLSRPRLDRFVPCEREEGRRSGTSAGTCRPNGSCRTSRIERFAKESCRVAKGALFAHRAHAPTQNGGHASLCSPYICCMCE
jgi:hypothetical protein